MKYQDSRDHIQGSHLMKHNLEAFLIQSAYIEGILKMLVDFQLFSQTEGKSHEEDNKFLNAVKNDLDKYSLVGLVDLLKKAEIISGEQKNLLDQYRIKRNKTLHNLLKQITSENFENELLGVYDIGEKITTNEEFKRMEKLLDGIEKGTYEGKSELK